MGCSTDFSLFSLILQSLLFALHILNFNINQTFFNSPLLQLEQSIILYYSDLIFLSDTDFQCLQYLFLPVQTNAFSIIQRWNYPSL